MNYLKWKLSEGVWGTNPSGEIHSRGGEAYPSEYVDTSTGVRLGYMLTSCDLTGLEAWEVTEITEAEALTFAQTYYPEAELLPASAFGRPAGEFTGSLPAEHPDAECLTYWE